MSLLALVAVKDVTDQHQGTSKPPANAVTEDLPEAEVEAMTKDVVVTGIVLLLEEGGHDETAVDLRAHVVVTVAHHRNIADVLQEGRRGGAHRTERSRYVLAVVGDTTRRHLVVLVRDQAVLDTTLHGVDGRTRRKRERCRIARLITNHVRQCSLLRPQTSRRSSGNRRRKVMTRKRKRRACSLLLSSNTSARLQRGGKIYCEA